MVGDFKNITVVGLGMIGGSVVKALKTKGYGGQIFGLDQNVESIEEAFRNGFIDNSTSDQKEIIEKSDLIILATPIGHFPKLLKSIKEDLKEQCIVTDVGSVKASVHQIAESILEPSQVFIGGHPMIGSEKSGFKASKGHLFENAYYFLTGVKKESNAMLALKEVVELMGAKVCIVGPEEHDRIVARTSHIPHLSAALLVNLIGIDQDALMDYVGGGFRDTTRIASGNPDMWTDIFIDNKKEVLDAVDVFMQQLEQFKKNLMAENKAQIVYNLNKAKVTREMIPKHLMDSIEQEYALFIDVQDRPGMIASVAGLMAENRINIKDIEILHARETVPGVLKVGFYSNTERSHAKQVLEDSEFGSKHTIQNGSEMQ